jgi:hypothetical protein
MAITEFPVGMMITQRGSDDLLADSRNISGSQMVTKNEQ